MDKNKSIMQAGNLMPDIIMQPEMTIISRIEKNKWKKKKEKKKPKPDKRKTFSPAAL
jgi:hypothetical protein